MDKEKGWIKVTNTRRNPRASAADQGQDSTDGGGADQQRDVPTGPPKTKAEAEAQGNPFYVRGFMSDNRIKRAIRRSNLCPMCGGVKEPAAGQQKCSGIMHCRFVKELGLEIRKIDDASPAKPTGATPCQG